MTLPDPMPSVDDLKAQAKRLRSQLAVMNTPVSHSQSLELLAQQMGLRDWNTLQAHASAMSNHRPPWAVGDFVRGRYLDQPCSGRILSLTAIAGGRFRMSLHLDEAVDVVTFQSFSSYRQRINATVDSHGVSVGKRSDGVPHLVLQS
ncbi:MAG: glyoxalase superfamily protein [Litoreibacter sp.]|uniref:glyoxalase superfamily protein n=1 Tax=Litoreibacter sp. TaxID=1969459 RepID=UPI003298F24D